jgi:hypothetical protein
MRIGINKPATEMNTPAWVEIDGEGIGEPDDIIGRFTRLSPVESDQPAH